MPYLKVNGTDLHYEEMGDGAETLVFSHGLLCSWLLFHEQMTALSRRYRCIAFDSRGHGLSESPTGSYDMQALCTDAGELIRTLVAKPCHVVGHSMGGFVALLLALTRPELVRSLVLLNTTADAETLINTVRYRSLALVARHLGLSITATPVMKTMFGRRFLRDPDQAARHALWRQRLLGNHLPGVVPAVHAVVRRQGIADQVAAIAVPTLIIAGSDDVVTRPIHSRRMASRIAGSQIYVLPEIGHCAPLEVPDLVTTAIRQFLATPAVRPVPGPQRAEHRP